MYNLVFITKFVKILSNKPKQWIFSVDRFLNIILSFSQTRPEQTGPDQTGPDQTRPDRTRPDRTRPDQTGPHQTRQDRTRSTRWWRERASCRAACLSWSRTADPPGWCYTPAATTTTTTIRTTTTTIRTVDLKPLYAYHWWLAEELERKKIVRLNFFFSKY